MCCLQGNTWVHLMGSWDGKGERVEGTMGGFRLENFSIYTPVLGYDELTTR